MKLWTTAKNNMETCPLLLVEMLQQEAKNCLRERAPGRQANLRLNTPPISIETVFVSKVCCYLHG